MVFLALDEVLNETDSKLLNKVLEIVDSANAEGYAVINIFTRSKYKRNLVKDWFSKLNFEVGDISGCMFELRW